MLENAGIVPLTGVLGAEVNDVQLADLVKRNDRSNADALGRMLMKIGAVTRVQKGARGENSGRAAIYRREI